MLLVERHGDDITRYDFNLAISAIKLWTYPVKAYKILKHFTGIITPDFSTYQDFPEPVKIWNTYRMRAFGYWYGKICHKQVINNVRWGTQETYNYCFEGIEKNSIVCIGTVGGSPKRKIDRDRFQEGFQEMIKIIEPSYIIVYGSDKYPCFQECRKNGIRIVQFDSRASISFKEAKHE